MFLVALEGGGSVATMTVARHAPRLKLKQQKLRLLLYGIKDIAVVDFPLQTLSKGVVW